MPTEGFMHKGRKVWSILYQLEAPPPTLAELVVPLNSDGYSLKGLATSDPPGRPIVAVKPGEQILFRGERQRVLAVEVYIASGGEDAAASDSVYDAWRVGTMPLAKPSKRHEMKSLAARCG